MPFLTFSDLREIIGATLAQQLCSDSGSFEAAERTAAQMVIDATGTAEPESGSESDAPRWAKAAAAHIILYNRIGLLAKLDPEFRAWARSLYDQALATLAEHKATPSDRVAGSTTAEMEGLPSW